MTRSEFMPYHNQHIEFVMNNGTKLSGVITDPMDSHKTGKSDTLYSFIPSKKMIDWKKAENDKKHEEMKKLEGEIDITNINKASFLR